MMKRAISILCTALAACLMSGCNAAVEETAPVTEAGRTETSVAAEVPINEHGGIQEPSAEDGFIYIKGGTFEMGSPDSEAWRSEDENLHSVSLNDFYLAPYEVTQAEYEQVMGTNPSTFFGRKASGGDGILVGCGQFLQSLKRGGRTGAGL